MSDAIVPLIRRFVPVRQLGDWDFLTADRGGAAVGWHQILDGNRVLILAGPGAGKTFEALDCARKLRIREQKTFFIRIEAIDAGFDQSFEIGDAAEFAAWLSSNDEAWFFLDSVDEAQLETPRALEEAIRVFGARIHDARERAHVFITSREDAWQALPDRTLIDQYLPFGAPAETSNDNDSDNEDGQTLKIYRLTGLSHDEIKLFAAHYGVSDASAFLDAIDRANQIHLAEQPFDLKALIRKWRSDGAIGGRLEMLRSLISTQLATLATGPAETRMDTARALAGARHLAATVTLTNKNVIALPEGIASAERIDPAVALPGWTSAQIGALLRTGVFDDIVYASVRFRHRDIRELLTAEWAYDLLMQPGGREKVESLFFRQQYGEDVLVARMRPTLAWLILFDPDIRDRALALEPEIATEGGDPSQLPLAVRRTMLAEIVDRIVKDGE